eukprot:8451920-Pyramimonas_sp.AAC.1
MAHAVVGAPAGEGPAGARGEATVRARCHEGSARGANEAHRCPGPAARLVQLVCRQSSSQNVPEREGRIYLRICLGSPRSVSTSACPQLSPQEAPKRPQEAPRGP